MFAWGPAPLIREEGRSSAAPNQKIGGTRGKYTGCDLEAGFGQKKYARTTKKYARKNTPEFSGRIWRYKIIKKD